MQEISSSPTNKLRIPQKRRRHKWLLGFGVLIVCLLVLSGASIATLELQPAFAANFADTVLRPIIGDQRTVAIESVLFQTKDRLDKVKYAHTQPPADLYEGVTPVISELPKSVSTSSPTATPTPSILTSLPTMSLNSTVFTPLPGEGVWQMVDSTASPNDPVLARSFVRPDSTRSFAIVNLVAMDMTKLDIAAVAGTQHPGGERNEPGPGMIPDSIQQGSSLVAAFNGGFQEKDGEYGMIVGSMTYVPLKKNLATLIIPQQGPLQIETYEGEPLTNVAAVRQNGLMLIANGQLQTKALTGDQLWAGATITGDFITWRSGIGLTANGTLIYAVGPSLSVQSLAEALQAAGAVNAMELDINTYWVRYILYNQQNGQYSYDALVQDMYNGGKEYLTGYQKDFFYVYRNSAS